MKVVQQKISPLISNQFPAFYREEGPLFVDFVKSYYEFLESTNNTLFHARNLTEYRDIDATLESFIIHFQTKYLKDLPLNSTSYKRDFIKHAVELYRSKGTIQSLRLLFNLLFSEQIEIYLPGDDVLRASDGEWESLSYLELEPKPRTLGFLGKRVFGLTSGASGIAQKLVRRNLGGKIIDVLYISDVEGKFAFNELVRDNDIEEGTPKIIGSLTTILVDRDNRGSGFSLGQEVSIVSTRKGKQATGIVKRIGLFTGKNDFALADGGFGYTNNLLIDGSDQKVWVSNNTLLYSEYFNISPPANNFVEFETLTQPAAEVSFENSNTTFALGDLVYGTNSTGGVIASGVVMSANQSANQGTLLLSPRSILNIDIENVANSSNTGSFSIGEAVTQQSTNTNLSYGYVLESNSSFVVLDVITGTFVSNVELSGQTSNCTADITTLESYIYNTTNFTNNDITSIIKNANEVAALTTAVDKTVTSTIIASNTLAIGSSSNNLPYLNNPFNYFFTNSTPRASIIAVGLGSSGGFKIGGINNSQTIYLNTDIIGSNNSGNVSYLSVQLDSSNSNSASNTGFGFPANPAANLTSTIASAWLYNSYVIGSISSLKEVDRGSNNTAKPFSVEKEPIIAALGKKEIVDVSISNLSKPFSNNELVSQFAEEIIDTITVANVQGSFDVSSHEPVYQTRSDGNTVYGILRFSSIIGNEGTLKIKVANTLLSFDNSNTIIGLYSNASALVSAVTTNTEVIEIKAELLSSNSTYMRVKKKSFQDFSTSLKLFGSESGANCDVLYVSYAASSNVLGNNAIVNIESGSQPGTLFEVQVVESGFGFESGETVLISSGTDVAQGTAVLQNEGTTRGRYKSTKGFLNSNKYIHDNNFYQDYSYQIRSGIDYALYDKIIEDTVHVAGTKRFGAFYKTSIGSIDLQSVPSSVTKTITLTLSNTSGTFTVGENVVQSNGSSNTANGVVMAYNSSINSLTLFNASGDFVSNNSLIGTSSLATANISSVNIQV